MKTILLIATISSAAAFLAVTIPPLPWGKSSCTSFSERFQPAIDQPLREYHGGKGDRLHSIVVLA